MNGPSAATALLAMALLVVPTRAPARVRLAKFVASVRSPDPKTRRPGWRGQPTRGRRRPRADSPRLAATWDLLAACLRAGLPVPTAIRAVVEDLPGPEAEALTSTAGLLALGADPVEAWAPAYACPGTAELAKAARRTARPGSALAEVADEMANGIRSLLADRAEARAQRAGVLIAGPLGLCFLPAFLCLGVVPVVLGLAVGLTIP